MSSNSQLTIALLEQGQRTYEGKLCPQGHTRRYASTHRCVECNRAGGRERARKRRKVDIPMTDKRGISATGYRR